MCTTSPMEFEAIRVVVFSWMSPACRSGSTVIWGWICWKAGTRIGHISASETVRAVTLIVTGFFAAWGWLSLPEGAPQAPARSTAPPTPAVPARRSMWRRLSPGAVSSPHVRPCIAAIPSRIPCGCYRSRSR